MVPEKTVAEQSFVVGVFLQANFGRRAQLTIAGCTSWKRDSG